MIKLQSFKVVKLLLGIFLFFLITYLFFDLLFDISNRLELHIKSLPADLSTALVIILLLMSDILLPIPSSIVMVTSGILFGGFLGGLIAFVGSLLGSIINFQVSRKLGQRKVKKWVGEKEYRSLSTSIQKYGAYIIILTRIVPLAMESVSSIAGISNMRLKKFIMLNIFGFVPTVFLYAYTGSVFKSEPQSIFIVLFIGFFVPLVIWYLLLNMTNIKSNLV